MLDTFPLLFSNNIGENMLASCITALLIAALTILYFHLAAQKFRLPVQLAVTFVFAVTTTAMMANSAWMAALTATMLSIVPAQKTGFIIAALWFAAMMLHIGLFAATKALLERLRGRGQAVQSA